MNTFSHLKIGDLLLLYLYEQHNIRLDRNAFLYGNVIPDFRHSFKNRPHERASWARYIHSEIGALSNSRQESACISASFSRRLGIICHFYADFFCRAHNPGFDGGSYEHAKYEWLLNRHLRGRMSILKRADIGRAVPEGLDATLIYSGFEALQRKYLDETPSHDNDIIYTLRACYGVLTAVTRNALTEDTESNGLATALQAALLPMAAE